MISAPPSIQTVGSRNDGSAYRAIITLVRILILKLDTTKSTLLQLWGLWVGVNLPIKNKNKIRFLGVSSSRYKFTF